MSLLPKPGTLQAKCIESVIEKKMDVILTEVPNYLLNMVEDYFNEHYCQKHADYPAKKDDCRICCYLEEKQERLERAINSCHCDYHENLLDDFEEEREYLDYGWKEDDEL